MKKILKEIRGEESFFLEGSKDKGNICPILSNYVQNKIFKVFTGEKLPILNYTFFEIILQR